jgi:hypothetical protein
MELYTAPVILDPTQHDDVGADVEGASGACEGSGALVQAAALVAPGALPTVLGLMEGLSQCSWWLRGEGQAGAYPIGARSDQSRINNPI